MRTVTSLKTNQYCCDRGIHLG